MFPRPNSYPTQNTHRMVHFFDAPRHTDFERIEDLLADAVRHLRAALVAMEALPYESFKPVQSWHRDLGRHAETQRLLTEDFRHAAHAALRELARQNPEAAPELLDRLQRDLRDALEASHRVSDLLAAEREIAACRGRHHG